MIFTNANTIGTTEEDQGLLRQVTIALQCLFKITITQRECTKKWNVHNVDCHSLARLLSLIFSECKLVDGSLIGLKKGEGVEQFYLYRTNHSWIVTPDGAIIDPYPMGITPVGSVLLVPTIENSYNAHGSNLYEANPGIRLNFDVTDSWRRARSHLRTIRKYRTDEMVMRFAHSISEV